MKSCWRILIASGTFKLFGDLCGLVGPLSISYIVDYINAQIANGTNVNLMEINATSANGNYGYNDSHSYNDAILHPDWGEFVADGWVMSFLVLIAFLLQGTFSQASTNFVNIEGIKIKNALQGLIYRKTLSLNCSCFSSSNNNNNKKTNFNADPDQNEQNNFKEHNKDNENDNDNEENPANDAGTITNLMSDDTLNVMSFFWIIHYVWSIPLKVSELFHSFLL